MIHAIHYADLVLIPVQPSNDDLKSAHSTARHVAQAGKSARQDIPFGSSSAGFNRVSARSRKGSGGGSRKRRHLGLKHQSSNGPHLSAPVSAAWHRSSRSHR